MMRATKQRFIQWLGGMPADAIVGERQQCASCPLAKFLQYLEPGCWPHVDSDQWTRYEGEERWRPMPWWAHHVVLVADALSGYDVRAGRLRQALSNGLYGRSWPVAWSDEAEAST